MRATPLKKTDCSSLRSHQLSIAALSGMKTHKPHPHQGKMLMTRPVFLFQSATENPSFGIPWAQESCHVQKTLVLPAVSFNLLSPLSWWSLILQRVEYRGPLYGWAFHWHEFSALWAAVSFCVNYHPLHKGASSWSWSMDPIFSRETLM